ncbi:MAG: tetratricopeptide repeat protein [Oligoflexia bacterium]|nr:tetratricopeptide repeat protein [Oligoflexia bacterium]
MLFKSMTREQLILWVRKNLKMILSAFVVAILLSVCFLTWNWWKKKQEYKAQVSLYRLQRSLQALLPEEETPFNFLKTKDVQKEFVLTKDMEQKALLYEQAIKRSQRFQTAVSFAIDLADFYYRYGQKEKAKEVLSLFAFPLKSHSLYHLAVFQLAGYYMNEKNCEKALPLLSQLSSNEKASAFHLESRLQKSLCLESMNRYTEALGEYEKLDSENPDSYIGRLAQDYKRLLILKEKLKK